jgi:D-arabinose 1-dehydrogenase-like Zn-dependent alcohol dehydrogenase
MSGALPVSMRAVVVASPGTAGLEIREVPLSPPAPGEVAVRVLATSIGRTVLRKVVGLPQSALPRVPGHEVIGEVVALGEGVIGIAPGQRVILYYYVTCGRCRMCLTGREPLCTMHGGSPVRLGEERDGGLAEYACVPSRNVVALPDGVDPVAATTIPDAIATPVHIMERSAARAGEQMIIIGAAGGVGIHLMQIAASRGVRPIAVDLGSRLEGLDAYCAADVVDASRPGWAERIRGAGDIVVDFVGTPETLEAGFDALSPSGRLIVLTIDKGTRNPGEPWRMVFGETAILGSRYASIAQVSEAAVLLRDGVVTPVITRTGGLDQAPDLLRAIERNEILGRAAMVIGS